MEDSIDNIPQNLPNDVISDIFSRLPVKNVTRCKSLSSHWNNVIRSSHFARIHLHQMRMKNRVYLRMQDEKRFAPLQMIPGLNGGQGQRRLFYPAVPTNEVVGTCNGLVLKVNMQDQIIIANPYTEQSLMLPVQNIPFPVGSPGGHVFFGFGYSESQDDYKVVRLTTFNEENGDTIVQIYSRNHNAWNDFGPYPEERPVSCPCIFVCGRLHWLLGQNYQVTKISAFDVTEQTFSSIAMPITPPQYDVFYELSSLNNETLIIFSWIYVFAKPFDVWMLKNYFNNDSWFKFSIRLVPPMDNILLSFFTVQPLFLVEPSKTKVMIRIDPIGAFGYWHINQNRFQLIPTPAGDEPHMSTFFKIIASIESPRR